MTFSFAAATTDEDARAIVTLHALVAERHRTEIAGARPWRSLDPSRVRALIRKPVTMLARELDVVVGSFRLDPARGFCGIARFTAATSFVYLFEMVVHPAYQRRGVGRLCLDEAERWARDHGASAIRLDTNDDGASAASFYAACGYREVLRHRRTIYLERLL